MDRRDFITVAALGALSAFSGFGCATTGRRAASRKPNVILILIDDLGYSDLGCYGSKLHETPRIDALAAQGVRFTQAYSACHVCSPARASILTGKYPARLNLTDYLKGKKQLDDSPVLTAPYADQLELEEVTLAERFRNNGYATAHIGKWHLGEEPFYPAQQGFDLHYAAHGGGSARSHFWPQWGDMPAVDGGEEGAYLADLLTDKACSFIESCADKPFFLNLWHYSVHLPLQAKKELTAKYAAKLNAKPAGANEHFNAEYAAMVESVDQSVGKILDLLKAGNLDQNTVVIFTSDNGGLATNDGRVPPLTTNFPLRSGKGHMYEGGIRVPLIVNWPGLTPDDGAVCHAPVCGTDFLPTLQNELNLPGPVRNIDGKNIARLLRTPHRSLADRTLYWHYPHFSNQGCRPSGAIREGDWKIIENYEDGALELYDLRNDVGETRNLATARPQIAKRLQRRLSQWRESVNATMPEPNPAYINR